MVNMVSNQAIKTYRQMIADNSKEINKSSQLSEILDNVFSGDTTHAKNILKYTIDCITNKKHHVELHPKIKLAIEYLVGNKNNNWITRHRDITRGASLIIAAASYKIETVGGDRVPFNTRLQKTQIINKVVKELDYENSLSLPRDKTGNIVFDKESYFDICNINNNRFTIAENAIFGDSYGYIQKQESNYLWG